MQQNIPAANLSPPATGLARALRAQITPGRCLVVPETPDGLVSRMVARAGFEAAFVGLMGSALNRIGLPDAGLLTASELVDNAARCIAAGGLPTVVDAGTGFGNPVNVSRTVAELVRSGCAGVLLRDGEDPARHRGAVQSITPAEMVAKLRAARDAQGESDLLLIAGIEGTHLADAAQLAHRAGLYLKAGADLLHLGRLGARDAFEPLLRALAGSPLTVSLDAESEMGAAELALFGVRMAFFPHCALMAAVPAIEHTFSELARTGTVGHLRAHIADFRQFTDIAGLPAVQQLEERYGVPEEQRTAL